VRSSRVLGFSIRNRQTLALCDSLIPNLYLYLPSGETDSLTGLTDDVMLAPEIQARWHRNASPVFPRIGTSL
jgi:hypothetical protein